MSSSPPATPTAAEDSSADSEREHEESTRFSAEEEQALLTESNRHKAQANSQFSQSHFSEAIQTYEKAFASCPKYLEYENAVLRANVAACQLKLSEWKPAVDSATEALHCLDRLDPPLPPTSDSGDPRNTNSSIVTEVDDDTAARIEQSAKSGRSLTDVQRLRAKALLRRAKAREEIGGWASLASAEEDYKRLASMPNLSSLDTTAVRRALVSLPSKLEAAKQQEMGEMMGKLKQLGNGILKPFGLSTDNFNFVQDEKSGGYSMQFNQGT